MNSSKQPKALVVVYFNYHLYGYIPRLVDALIEEGFRVRLLTCDKNIVDMFKDAGSPSFSVQRLRYLSFAMRIMEHNILRPFIWMLGWVWSFIYSLGYDVVIAPTDNKPFYHMITAWKKSIICDGGLGNYDKQYLQHKYRNNIEVPGLSKYISPKNRAVDRIFGVSFLNDVRGDINKKHYCVLGRDVCGMYEYYNVPSSHIHPVGNPNYEGLFSGALPDLDVNDLLGLTENDHLYMFFSSQLKFAESDLEKLSDYVDILFCHDASAIFCMKLHPRITKESLQNIKNWAKKKSERIKILTDLSGDENNCVLIDAARAIFVEDSNVGVLSAHRSKPLFIIELGGQRYTGESFFLFYDGIMNCTSLSGLENNIACLSDDIEMQKVIQAQKKMTDCVCLKNNTPCRDIAKLAYRITEQ